MQCKLAFSALVVAAWFGATAIASAQVQPAPGTTTGSATKPRTIKGVAPNPSFQDSRDAGTGRGK